VTDPEGEITRFTYDAYGDVISMIDPSGGTTTFAYFAVPEPSTWAMMVLSFAGLGFAGYRARKRTVAMHSSTSRRCWRAWRLGAARKSD